MIMTSAARAIREKLEGYYQEVSTIILSRQNPATGLIPASVAITTHGNYTDAWVRDNVYSIYAVWGLALAFRRIDDDQGVGYELEHATIKCMRGLLYAMLRQAPKVEQFKNTQALEHSLHAKYNTATADTVVGDFEWGHLQIDATSIFVLALAQMTTSGLKIIYTLDEVAFIQNLVTPDYGIWERGNKINHGMPELNSSSIGMALAALQAINGVNLFGSSGGPSSVIHVLPDELTRNYTTLHSALPRESNSKEVDAALLSVISFPAFAVQDLKLVERTRNDIIKKLGGKYGCKRFLRDGHQAVLEDTSRLHYDPHELKVFEHIECEWPLFFTYLLLDGFFRGDQAQVEEYKRLLEPLLVESSHTAYTHSEFDDAVSVKSASSSNRPNFYRYRQLSQNVAIRQPQPPRVMKLVPELYIVPKDKVEAEKADPGSQARVPNENVPLVWAQSLYILGNLMFDNLLSPAELDPLGRRLLPHRRKLGTEVVVQIVLLAESAELQARLAMYGLDTQTLDSCAPVTIAPPSVLRDAYLALGDNKKLGLTGRPKRPVGTIGTCKLYRCQGRLYGFLPHFMDKEEFYLVSDNDYLVSVLEQELAFVKNHWWYTGRPTMMVMLTNEMLGNLRVKGNRRHGTRFSSNRNLLNFMMSLRSGICGGVRVRVGRLTELISTACIESLDFLVGSNSNWYETLNLQLFHTVSTALPLSEKDDDLQVGGRTTTPRRRTVRRAGDRTSFHSSGSRSPLTSPFYTEEPHELPEVSELSSDTSSVAKGDSTPAAKGPSRPNSPSRGASSNTSGKATVSASSSRRQSFRFDTTNLAVDTKVATAVLQGPQSAVGEGALFGEVLNITLGDPSHVPHAVALLKSSANLYDQIDLIHYLHSCHGLEYHVEDLGTVSTLLEEVYDKAMQLKLWSIVRQSAGLLFKTVNSLTINVSDLLIRQKPVTFGTNLDNGLGELLLDSPLAPAVLAEIVYKHCASDVREAPLVQEVITCLGSLIRSQPSIFDGIMRIRTHFLIIAMREEISLMRACDEEQAVEHLMQLSPFEMKSLLVQVLNASEQTDPVVSASMSVNGRRSINVHSAPGALKLSATEGSLPNSVTIVCQSAGFHAGNFARIELTRDTTGVSLPIVFGRGLNICILDSLDGTILDSGSFDTHISAEEAEEFARVIDYLEAGTIVVVVCKDDASENLTESSKSALESLGAGRIRDLTYRDSYCLIGEKGAEKGSVPEMHRAASAGPSDVVKKTFDLAARRKTVLTALAESPTERNPEDGDKEEAPVEGQPTSAPTEPAEKVSESGGSKVADAKLSDTPAKAVTATSPSVPVTLSTLSVPTGFPALLMPSNGRWLRRRKNDGALNRVPPEFYPRVWKILSKCTGILIGPSLLPRDPTVSEKTPEEFNFALQVESLLDAIRDPAERQIAVECLMVISRIEERNPEIKVKGATIDLMKIIRDAVQRFWSQWIGVNGKALGVSAAHDVTFERNERLARRLFFDLAQDGKDGTMGYLATSCVRLVFDVVFLSSAMAGYSIDDG
ncbi:glycosyl hydrolases family 15-domain-containing protein [Cladochytrium replicatum]|nr:glycosyl hydrolases family 15-domain-containing protein [Cladochytrium replicatum]